MRCRRGLNCDELVADEQKSGGLLRFGKAELRDCTKMAAETKEPEEVLLEVPEDFVARMNDNRRLKVPVSVVRRIASASKKCASAYGYLKRLAEEDIRPLYVTVEAFWEDKTRFYECQRLGWSLDDRLIYDMQFKGIGELLRLSI